MFYCYLLFSPKLNRFYIGSTQLDPEKRLEHHLTKHYGIDKFTAVTTDWELFLTVPCDSIKQAKQIERHIKKMKSSKYIKNLRKYPEISEKLKKRFSD